MVFRTTGGTSYQQEISNPAFMDPIILNTQRLVGRVGELEDLVIELKQRHQASDTVELKQIIS